MKKKAVPFLSAHDLISITYKIGIKRSPPRSILCRNFRNFNEQSFLSDIGEYDWTDLTSSNNIEEKVDIFNNKVLDHLNRHAPLQRIHFRNLPAPWLTEEIRKRIRERNRLRRVWRRHKNDTSYKNYKISKNSVQNMVREAKKSYHLAAFEKIENPIIIWSRLRHPGLIRVREDCKRLACTAEELNAYFSGSAAQQV